MIKFFEAEVDAEVNLVKDELEENQRVDMANLYLNIESKEKRKTKSLLSFVFCEWVSKSILSMLRNAKRF